MTRGEPTISVQLVRPGRDGERIDLSSRVLSIEFEDEETKADRVVLSVDNWDLKNFDSPVWAKGNRIRVAYGYIGRMAPARDMIIKKVTGFTTLSVIAYSKAFLMDSVRRTRTFKNMTRSQAVAQVAEENGYGRDARTIQDTETVYPTIQQANVTDAQFIRRLSRKEGFEFYVDQNGLRFAARNIAAPPARLLAWRTDQRGTILDINVQNDVTRQPSKYIIRGRDRLAKKDFEVEIDPIDDLKQTLARAADVVPVAGPAVGVANALLSTVQQTPVVGQAASAVVAVVMSDEPTAEAAKKAFLRKAARRRQSTFKLEIEIVGDPLLLAKSVVRIGGIGELLSGNYYIKRHRHRISEQGYTGTLEVIRDGKNERRGASRLFEGGGISDEARESSCEFRVIRVQAAVKLLLEIRNRLVPAAVSQGIGFSEDSLVITNAKLQNMAAASARLNSVSRDQIGAPLQQIHDAASGFRAAALSFPFQVRGPMSKQAYKVQIEVEQAQTACVIPRAPAVNELDPADQDALFLKQLESGSLEWGDLPSTDEAS